MTAKILVVDGSKAIQQIVANSFENEDAIVERVSNGDEALAQVFLLRGLRRDPTISFMFDEATFFVPEGEEHYHLGLMYQAPAFAVTQALATGHTPATCGWSMPPTSGAASTGTVLTTPIGVSKR